MNATGFNLLIASCMGLLYGLYFIRRAKRLKEQGVEAVRSLFLIGGFLVTLGILSILFVLL